MKDFDPFDSNHPQFRGCRPKVRHSRFDLSVCQGKRVTFRVVSGRFKLFVHGTGIYIAAVGRGTVTVEGDRGVMSLNNGPYTPLPRAPATYPLAASP